MPEILNATAATPERVAATEALTQTLFNAVKASRPSDGRVVLDALISTYISTVIHGGQQHVQSAIKDLATVRLALLSRLQPAGDAPLEKVKTLANLVLLPDMAGHDHAIALSALLSVYRDLVMRYPCCMESHAVQLFALWQTVSAGAAAADSLKPTTH